MKWTGLLSIVCATALTVACGDRRDDGTVIEDRDDDVITDRDVGDPTIGTAGDTGIRTGNVQEFVRDAAMNGNAEVQLGQLASERASSDEVKQFAQMMVRDHTRGNNDLKQAVSGHDVQIPAEIDDKHQELMEKLRGLRGAEFDREYMAAMVEGHQEMKNMLGGRADDTRREGDPAATTPADHDAQLGMAVNQWAAKTLPSVDQHLERAEQIQDRLENTRTSTANR